MSLETRLQARPDEKIVRLSLSPQQSYEYLDRQRTYVEQLFGPILQLATGVVRTPHEVFDLYVANNSGTFSGAYLRFLERPDFAGPDPTYDAGIAILIKTYAQLHNISETQASLAFLDANIYEAYDERYHAAYEPLVSQRIQKHQREVFARAG